MKRILVTGSRGFVGSRFIRAYGDIFSITGTSSVELDLKNYSAVLETFKNVKPDIVLHTSAIAQTAYCNDNPELCHAANVDASLNIARASDISGARFVFLSTEQVFNGNSSPGPYSETDKAEPDTVYGQNKLEAEGQIQAVCSDSLILRLTWMFGVPENGSPVSDNILWGTLKNIIKGKPFKVPDNEYRGLTYIGDLIREFSRILELPAGIYHTGSENSLSRYETVRLIFNEAGLGDRFDELVIRDTEKYRDAARDIRLDTSRLKSAGITFPESTEALAACIRDYSLTF